MADESVEPLGDLAFGAVVGHEEHRAFHVQLGQVLHVDALLAFEGLQPLLQQVGVVHADHARALLEQRFGGAEHVAAALALHDEGVAQRRLDALGRIRLEAELESHVVRGAEADAADEVGQLVGVGAELLLALRAEDLEDARGVSGRDLVTVQEHDEAFDLALGAPGLDHALQAFFGDALDLEQTVGIGVQNVQHGHAKTLHQRLGRLLAHALQRAFEKAHHAVDRGGIGLLEIFGLQLAAELGMRLPLALDLQKFAGGELAQTADDGDDAGLILGAHAHHRVAVVWIVVDDGLDLGLDAGGHETPTPTAGA